MTHKPVPAGSQLLALALPAALFLAAPLPGLAQQVRVCTNHGEFTIELAAEAPLHTENFLGLVDSGFYNGTLFHRVIDGRLVQGGAYDRRFIRRPAGEPVANESGNGLKNLRGTVAAARLRDPDSAQSQFFVNLSDSSELDATSRRPGYTVFGRITDGLDVLDAIGRLPTGAAGPLSADVPEPVAVIEAMTRVADPAPGESAMPPAGTADAPADSGAPASDDALNAADALRAACTPVPPSLLVSEARAALDTGRAQRARYALENFFVTAASDDPDMPLAQSLFRRLPRSEQAGIAPLIAHCPRAAPPALPAGQSATMAEMERAQSDVRSFIMASEAFLECLADVIDDGSLDEVQEVAAVGAHNEVVTRMERAAEDFNRALRAFRERD